MRVEEIMLPAPAPVSPLATLQTAAIRMRDLKTNFLPVCNEGSVFGTLVGVVTTRDIVVRTVAEGRDGMFSRVSDAMTTPAFCCMVSDLVERARDLLSAHQIENVPVLDVRQRLVGIVSRTHLPPTPGMFMKGQRHGLVSP